MMKARIARLPEFVIVRMRPMTDSPAASAGQCDIGRNNIQGMSQMSMAAIDDFDMYIVTEIQESWAETGHRVRSALELDEDFTINGAPQSELSRAKIGAAFKRGAGKSKFFNFSTGPGGSKEASIIEQGVERVVRLLKGTRNDAGDIVIRAKDRSILENLEPDSLYPQERWVMGYILSEDTIAEIFVAKVLDVLEGNPGQLVLGTVTYLEGATQPGPNGNGFQSEDEDLDWGDDEGDAFGEETA